MGLPDEIVIAKDRIATLFLRQCRDGPQNAPLTPHDVKACGQRLDEGQSTQRGLHGTAAAIRVLGEFQHADCQDLVPRLVRYVMERESVETPDRLDDVREDSRNVIKISEALYALRHVNNALARTEDLRGELSNRLLEATIAGRGWGYYTDLPDDVELLPTAIAVQALRSEGYKVEGAVEYLLSQATTDTVTENADVSVRVLCLYVLAFGNRGESLVDVKALKKPFLELWARLSSLMKHDDIEQNVEYEHGSDHRYVRVPWQLYLIALASRLAAFRTFSARATQLRLRSILREASGPRGFIYPHSGNKVSARTNSILYDVLSKVERRLPEISWKLKPGEFVDFLVNSPWTAWVARLLAVLVIGISVQSWWQSGASLGELAPDLLSALLLFVLSGRRAR